MKVETASLDDLVPDPNNTRTHGVRNLEAIKASLKQFGQVEPLVVQKATGKVVGGNGRLEALRALKKKSAAVVYVDLDDAQAEALSVALNRTAELADWDYEKLASSLADIAQTGMDVGFTEAELDTIVGNAQWDIDDSEEAGEGKVFKTEPLEEPKRFQVTVLDESLGQAIQEALEKALSPFDADVTLEPL